MVALGYRVTKRKQNVRSVGIEHCGVYILLHNFQLSFFQFGYLSGQFQRETILIDNIYYNKATVSMSHIRVMLMTNMSAS